jgi:glycosyltransferase involved in cell wall biosynthesis
MRALFGEAGWRERLGRAGWLPSLARAASPGFADVVVDTCRGGHAAGLHVMRSYLAPLGIAVAERLAPAWTTLDLDDDDAAVAASLGDQGAAAAYDRLLGVFAPLFDGLSAASAPEAQALSTRHRLDVEHIPNAVDLPEQDRTRRGADREVSILFVGNLTYVPNAQAAHALVEEILPRAQSRLGRAVRLTLVGHHHPELKRLAGPSVELAGYVSDLSAAYAGADVVVVPLTTGGGTRIKVLEAFAHGVPVVASPVAVAGLAVSNGRHLMLADDPDRTVAAIAAVVTAPALAAHLTEQAQKLVRARYCIDVVSPQIRDFFTRAATRAGGRLQVASSP